MQTKQKTVRSQINEMIDENTKPEQSVLSRRSWKYIRCITMIFSKKEEDIEIPFTLRRMSIM